MKKFTIFIVIVLFGTLTIFGQGVPNGDMESWGMKLHFENPKYMNSSNFDAFIRGGTPNALKSTDAHYGSYAIKLQSGTRDEDTTFGYFLFGVGNDNGLEGGIPFTEKPDSFKAWFKYNIAAGTEGLVVIFFKKDGVPISQQMLVISSGTINAWTEMSFKLDTFAGTPDTIAFGIVSANPFNNMNDPANWIMVDKMAFTGVTNQLPNSGFEEWVNVETEEPDLWMTFNVMQLAMGMPNNVTKSTDAHSGTYSMSIKTASFDMMGGNVLGIATTGMIGDNGFTGGFPVSKKADSFCFYYKYDNTSNPGDSAQVMLMYSKAGTMIDAALITLAPSTAWKRVSAVFMPDTIMIPDTCNMILSSSELFGGNAAIGSVLKIDDLLFYYGTVGIPVAPEKSADAFIYPNPAAEQLHVNFVLAATSSATITIYNIDGKMISRNDYTNLPEGNNNLSLNINDLPAGNYILSIVDESNNPYFSKFTIVR